MRILVTGASGLLGLNLALEAAKEHVVTVKNTVYGQVHSHFLQTDAFAVLECDLTMPGAVERLLDQSQPDWVINCAALADLDACEADPARAQQLNTDLPARLATYVARGGARLLHVSTDSVFDGQRGDYTEEDQPNPLGVYARSKLAGERAVAEANPEAIIGRVNMYGWSLTGKRSLSEFFFYNLQAGKRVMGWTDVYFCPLLVNDLAQIFLKMLNAGLSGLYHVVSSECIDKYSFGVALARQFSAAPSPGLALDEHLITPVSVAQAGMKAARSPKLTLRADKIAAALGEQTPGILPGLVRYAALYEQGYPQRLKSLLQSDQAAA